MNILLSLPLFSFGIRSLSVGYLDKRTRSVLALFWWFMLCVNIVNNIMKEQSKYHWNIHSEGFSNFVRNSLGESLEFSFLTETSVLS